MDFWLIMTLFSFIFQKQEKRNLALNNVAKRFENTKHKDLRKKKHQ